MDLLSTLVGFVIGAFTGAAGQYLAAKYTDKRRLNDRAKEQDRVWEDLVGRFPDVIEEMRQDVKRPGSESVREFFVKSSKTIVNRSGPSFEYHTDIHAALSAAIAQLQRVGYIEDITPGNCPMYRMTEEFVDRLKND